MTEPKTPDEAIALWMEKLNNISHCCECERGISHSICIQYCKATSEQNCIYIWKGQEYIVGALNLETGKAMHKLMDFNDWEEWTKDHPIIKLGDYGLASP